MPAEPARSEMRVPGSAASAACRPSWNAADPIWKAPTYEPFAERVGLQPLSTTHVAGERRRVHTESLGIRIGARSPRRAQHCRKRIATDRCFPRQFRFRTGPPEPSPPSSPPNGFGVPGLTVTVGAPGSTTKGCICIGAPFRVCACCAMAGMPAIAKAATPPANTANLPLDLPNLDRSIRSSCLEATGWHRSQRMDAMLSLKWPLS